MAVTVTDPVAGPYTPNGSTTDFAFAFKAADEEEVSVVQVLDGATTVIPASEYSVTTSVDTEGGTVSFSTAPATGSGLLYIISEPLFTQTTEFDADGPFTPRSLNTALDRAAIRDILLGRRIDGAIRVPVTGTMAELPAQADRAGKFLSFDGDGNPIVSSGTGADADLRTDLAASSGGALVGFVSDKSGAVARSATAKGRDSLSLRDFGAVGSGASDDTTKIDAAIDAGNLGQFRINVPEGTFTATAAYTNATAHTTVRFRGEGRKGVFGQAAPAGSVLELDSASASSFFYAATEQYSYLDVDGVVCTTAQAVTDRAFFKLNHVGPARFEDVEFDGVDMPVVVEPEAGGGYIQSASFRDTSFYDSGTIHSSVGDVATEAAAYVDNLRGTLWRLDNVNHEGTVPANSDQVVMNLYGVRDINADNLLLEGALPAAGWTVLKIGNPYNQAYTRREFFLARNVHIEFAGTQPTYAVDQEGGTAVFEHLNGLGISGALQGKYKLSSLGKAIIAYTSFSTTSDEPSLFFERDTTQCIVIFSKCAARTVDLTKRGFIHELTQVASATDGVGQCVVSNTGTKILYEFDGGIIATGGDFTLIQSGSTPYVSTDPTYGRKWVIPPAATFDVALRIATKGLIVEGDQVMVQAKVQLPTFTGGSISFTVGSNTTLSLNTQSFGTAYSGQIVDVFIPYTRKSADAWTQVGFRVTSTTISGYAGNIEVLANRILYGRTVAPTAFHPFPKNISTSAAAMPSLGSWAQGDYVANNAPTANGVLGWLRLTTGSGHVAGTDWMLVRSIQQQAAVADATGGATIDAEARAAVNAVIARLEAAGILAP